MSKGRIAQMVRASALQAEGHPFKSGFAQIYCLVLIVVGFHD